MELAKGLFIHSRILLAPLAGYTDLPFRLIAKEHGAGLVFTELISSEGIVRHNKKTLDLMRISDAERPVGIQLFGKDPHVMAEAAILVELLHPDVIDINIGCCAPKVCSGDSGAALLKKPDLLNRIVSSITDRVKIPVSAKIRIGWDDNTKNYMEIVNLLTGAGISFITVHGRTRSQKYTGSADWNIITEIAGFSRIPIIGNGDILSYDQACTLLNNTGCAAVMVGRASIGNPWIFSGKLPTLPERIRVATRHLNLMVEYYGDYGVILSRKHLVRYFHHFRNAANIRAEIVKARTPDEVRAVLSDFGRFSDRITDAL